MVSLQKSKLFDVLDHLQASRTILHLQHGRKDQGFKLVTELCL